MPPVRTVRRRDQRGNTLLELALCLPLFVAVISGITAVSQVLRARWQLATVAHALMREAAGGNGASAFLAAKAYEQADPGRFDNLQGTASSLTRFPPGALGLLGISNGLWLPWLMDFTRVEVSGTLRVRGILRHFLPDGIRMSYANVVMAGTWKNPYGMVYLACPLPPA